VSTEEKPKGIPLSALLKPDGEIDTKIRKLKPGSSGGVVMVLTQHRNLEAMMGQERGDPKLRVALTKELLKQRADAEAKAAPFQGRKPGATKQVQYIRDLVADNPKLYPRELWDKADPTKLFGMTETNFKKRASEARSDYLKSLIGRNQK
jgi:hypothetical protein